MSRAPLPSPFEPRPVRSIPLPRVARSELDAVRLFGEVTRAGRVRAEIECALCDVVDSTLCIERRPAVELLSGTTLLQLASADVALEENEIAADGAGFELRRGRSAVRVIRTGPAPISRNGWLLETGVPVTLRDGDTIAARGRTYRATYERPIPRPPVEIGPPRLAERPSTSGFDVCFVVEPAGEPLVLVSDGATARAVLDLVAGGSGERPYDRTALAGVERAVVEWTVDRAAHAAARAIAGAAIGLTVDGPRHVEPDIWFTAAVRVGCYCCVWWVGTTRRALESIAPILAERSRPSLAAHAAVAGIDATVVALVALGRLSPDELAGLEPGDVLVARGGPTRGSEGLRGEARLAVDASREIAPAAFVEQFGATIRARLMGRSIEERSDEMERSQDGATPERPFEAALEGLTVTICVEVARRRLPLSHLLTLAPGDVVELHAAVQNDVTLTVDGGAFARAELVDADGALAVRILALGGHR